MIQAPQAAALVNNGSNLILEASMSRNSAYAEVTGLSTMYAHEVEAWAYATIDVEDHDAGTSGNVTYSFNANGSGAQYRVLSQLDFEGPTTAASVSVLCGGPSPITAADEPSLPSTPAHTNVAVNRFYVVASTAIVKWDVAGGFAYVD